MQATLTVNLQRGESPTCAACGHKVSSHTIGANGVAGCFGCQVIGTLCKSLVRVNENHTAELQINQPIQKPTNS